MGDVLVGRQVESLALDDELAAAASSTRAALVAGPPGIGKTAIVQSFLARARQAGALGILTHAVPAAEAELPYAPVAQMLRQLHRDHPARLAAAIGPQTAAIISTLAPDAIGSTDLSPPPRLASPALERGRLLSALWGVVEGLTVDGPVVLVVEDLHWVDGRTLGLLDLLLRGTPETGLLVVATVREPTASARVRSWCAIERAAGRLSVVSVPPLTVAETGEMLAALGVDDGPTGRVAEVHRTSGGNPFLVRELARVDPGVLPGSVRAVVDNGMDSLPGAGQNLVRALAVAGRRIDHETMVRFVGERAVTEGAAAAVASGLVTVDDGGYDLIHDLARTAVHEALLPADRRGLHLAFAHVLTGRIGDEPSASDLIEVAWHFEQGGSRVDTYDWAMRAADAAEQAGHWAEAHLQLERALAALPGVSPELTRRARSALLVRVAAAADYAGDLPAALKHVDAAWRLSDQAEDGQWAALVQARRSWLLMVLDQVTEAVAAAEQALSLLPRGAEATAVAEVHIRAALVMGSTGRTEDALNAARRALAAADAVGDERLRGRAMRELGGWRNGAPDPEAMALLHGAWQRAVQFGDPEDIAGIGVILSEQLFRSGELARSARTALDAHELLSMIVDSGHWMDGIVVGNACQALMALGRWDEVSALLDRAVATDALSMARLTRARLRLAQGALGQAEDDLMQVPHLRRHDQPYFGLAYDELLAELRLVQRRPGSALRIVTETLDDLDEGAVHDLAAELCLLGVRACADIAEEARAVRDEERLRDALEQGHRLARMRSVEDGMTAARRCALRGELGRLDRDPQPAAWSSAADLWASQHQPFRRAYALWRQAEAVLDVGGNRPGAGTLLQEAASVARDLGAVGLLAEIEALSLRARLPLRRPRPPARGPGAGRPGSLSERETAVLRLIVLGRTNKEIGAELYISPKTVSVHVSRLMQKLGVRSRVQAAGVAHRLGL